MKNDKFSIPNSHSRKRSGKLLIICTLAIANWSLVISPAVAGTNAALTFNTNTWQIGPPGILASNAAALSNALAGIGFTGGAGNAITNNWNALFPFTQTNNTEGGDDQFLIFNAGGWDSSFVDWNFGGTNGWYFDVQPSHFSIGNWAFNNFNFSPNGTFTAPFLSGSLAASNLVGPITGSASFANQVPTTFYNGVQTELNLGISGTYENWAVGYSPTNPVWQSIALTNGSGGQSVFFAVLTNAGNAVAYGVQPGKIFIISSNSWAAQTNPFTLLASWTMTNQTGYGGPASATVVYGPGTNATLQWIVVTGASTNYLFYNCFIASYNLWTGASNAPTFALQMPNGYTNLVNSICYDNAGNLFGCCEIETPIIGISPLNCLLEWTSNGTFLQAVTLSKAIWNAQGVCFNGTNFFVVGNDTANNSPLAGISGGLSGFSVTYPVNGFSYVQEVGKWPVNRIFTGLCQVPNPTNAFLFGTAIDTQGTTTNSVVYLDYSCTNLAAGTDATGTTYIHNLELDGGGFLTGSPLTENGSVTLGGLPWYAEVQLSDYLGNAIVFNPSVSTIWTSGSVLAIDAPVAAPGFGSTAAGNNSCNSSATACTNKLAVNQQFDITVTSGTIVFYNAAGAPVGTNANFTGTLMPVLQPGGFFTNTSGTVTINASWAL
jgi:hypothetical protein